VAEHVPLPPDETLDSLLIRNSERNVEAPVEDAMLARGHDDTLPVCGVSHICVEPYSLAVGSRVLLGNLKVDVTLGQRLCRLLHVPDVRQWDAHAVHNVYTLVYIYLDEHG